MLSLSSSNKTVPSYNCSFGPSPHTSPPSVLSMLTSPAGNSITLYLLTIPTFLIELRQEGSVLPFPSPCAPPPAILSLDASVMKELSEVKFSVAAVGACPILGHCAREATAS